MRHSTWLWIIIVVAGLLTAPLLVQRAALERSNDTVEIVADLESLKQLSAWTGVALADVLQDWAARGVTSAAVVDAADIDVVDAAGLRVVPRTTAVVEALFGQGAAGAPLIAAGEYVPGWPDRLVETARLLDRTETPLGVIEFANQAGARELAALLGDVAVFVHSIPPRELARLTEQQALARFNRAALERQARVLYVHPLTPSTVNELILAGEVPDNVVPEEVLDAARMDELLQRNGRYVSALVDLVQQRGLLIGPVQPLPTWTSSVATTGAVMAAAAAAGLLVGRQFLRFSWRWEAFALTAAAGFVTALAVTGRDVLARQAAALAVACTFPVLAIVVGASSGKVARADRFAASSPGMLTTSSRSQTVRFITANILKRFGGVMAVTLAGAVLVTAALADSTFLLKLEQFRGVKVAHLVPLVLAALLWIKDVASALRSGRWGRPDDDGTKGTRAGEFSDALVSWLRTFRWRAVVLALAVGSALFILIARTGHDVLPVTTWERTAREALERWLVVRPRTKEFMFAYPALFIGLYCFAVDRRSWGWPLLVAGTVAPISVINTFSHAHIALWVSAVRTLYGVALGAIVPGMAAAALSVWWRRRRGDFTGAFNGPGVPAGGPDSRAHATVTGADSTRMHVR